MLWMGQKEKLVVDVDLGYRLRPKTISPLFADPPSTTYVLDGVPR